MMLPNTGRKPGHQRDAAAIFPGDVTALAAHVATAKQVHEASACHVQPTDPSI